MTQQAPTQDQIRDSWDAIASKWDEFTTPLTMLIGEELLHHVEVGPGQRLLDVGAGSGSVAVPAARRGAQVVAIDIAPAMIDALHARARREGLSHLKGLVMDGLALDFADGTFDVSASLNGVALFPDVARALAELVRVTKPGGQAVIGVPAELPKLEFIAFLLGAIKATVPDFAPPAGPMPQFQMADPEVFRQRLVEAGLTGLSVETVTCDLPFDSAEHLWNMAAISNPIGAQLAANLTADQQAQVRQVLDGMLRERSGGEPGAVLHVDIHIGVGTK